MVSIFLIDRRFLAFTVNAEAEEEEIVRDLFNEIDINHDGGITIDELQQSVIQYSRDKEKPLQLALAAALERLVKHNATDERHITFEAFRNAVRQLPRVKGERCRFAHELGVHEMMAGLLPKGTFFDGLEGLRKLAKQQDHEIAFFAREMVAHLTPVLETLLLQGISTLRGVSETVTNALEQNSKFSMDFDARTGSFATLEDFYEGPDKYIGSPNPKAAEGIRREHCERKNADTILTTENYGIATSPRIEYYFVVDPKNKPVDGFPHTPKDRSQWRDAHKLVWKGTHGRDEVELIEFTEHDIAKNACLHEEEVIVLRLYTGPMYVWYNAVLRGFPEEVTKTLEGNQYETTIFCIISGIIKLSRLTKVPENRRLYRGLSGMLLPEAFWTEKEGFRGGVERGLMSTTTSRSVAMQYSGSKDGKRCAVFEIIAGRIDMGAELSWVSQYPSESEVLRSFLILW